MAIWQIIVICILLFISALAKAIQDKLQFHFEKSVFKNIKNIQFWNPQFSWRNKYKNYDPTQGEKFLGSSTIFVSLLDGWHLFGLIRDFSVIICFTIITLNPYYLLIYPLYRLVFHIFFTFVLTKK